MHNSYTRKHSSCPSQ
uniref:Uncharacterized protein n=1 Tax=Arundo donax TaxID=35708 RepID=A0A0A9FN25_ARUDO